MQKEFLLEQGISEELAEVILGQHTQELESLQFRHDLEGAILRAGGRSVKAITALLDVEALRGAEDPAAAAAQALKTLKKDSGYLFAEQTPPPYAHGTGAFQPAAAAPQTLAGALRERFRT